MSAPVRTDINRETQTINEVSKIIDDMFEYHPWSDTQTQHGSEVRKILAQAVKIIVDNVPPCADRSVAIRKIREARMDCNSAITHNGRY